ncbi:MAG: PD40 domain-containing protein [Chloroflexi bacterium]|nr:PD40 domain-containing protein [Chloroflexota bacterium]
MIRRQESLVRFVCLSMAVMMVLGLLPQGRSLAENAAAGAAPLESSISVRGDLTGDGIIDGRDVLKVMRIVDGFRTATADDIARGDVHPLPGTGGRLMGDGQLTRDDASKILRTAVGLVPQGELTLDFGGSPPRVAGFAPNHGPAGARVTLFGENFVTGALEENMVFFGDTPAPVHSSTGKTLETEVPAGADISRVRVVTPGGEGVSPFTFETMVNRPGKLVPYQGRLPTDYGVVNSYGDEVEPGSDGKFSVPMAVYGITTHYGVPKDGSDRILLLVDIARGPASQEVLTPQETNMDLLSTARALLFINPTFANPFPEQARLYMTYIQDDPKVAVLAQVLGTLYQAGPQPFGDAGLATAYSDAVGSVLGRIPDGFKVSLPQALPGRVAGLEQIAGGAIANEGLKWAEAGNLGLLQLSSAQQEAGGWTWEALYPDTGLTRIKGSEKPGSIIPETDWSNALDWLAVLAEVKDIYDTFPLGMQNIAAMKPRQVLSRATYSDFTFIPPQSLMEGAEEFFIEKTGGMNPLILFDPLRAVFDGIFDGITWGVTQVFPSLEGVATPDMNLHVDPNRDGVYVVRNFSGRLGSGIDAGEFDFLWQLPEGERSFYIALGMNIAMVAIDFTSFILLSKFQVPADKISKMGLKGIFSHAVKKSIQVAMVKGLKGSEGIASGELTRTVLSIFYEVLKETLTIAAREMAGLRMQQAQSTIAKALGVFPVYPGPILDGLKAFHRLGTMVVFPLLPGYTTPLETWIVVVGSPFTPVITRVTPGTATPGETVTLEGKNFDYRNKVNNEVRLGEFWQDAAKAEALEVSTDGKSLKFKVPEDQSNGAAKVWLRTPYSGLPSEASQALQVKRIPRLLSISPTSGFAPVPSGSANPLAGFKGTLVTFNGLGLKPPSGATADKVYIGGMASIVESTTPTEVKARVPALQPGATRVQIYSQEVGVYSQDLAFTVLGSPTLSGITPAQAMVGQYVELQGGRLGASLDEVKVKVGPDAADGRVLSVSGDKLAFEMPSAGEAGQQLQVVVWTPAGSASITITRLAGIQAPQTGPRADPYYRNIPVHSPLSGLIKDGKISLDEAAALARRALNPYLDGWDDKDIKITVHYYQQKTVTTDQNGNQVVTYPFTQGESTTETLTGHAGKEYRRTYRIDHLHPDKGGGQSAPYMTMEEDLDATPETMEEGDYVDIDPARDQPDGIVIMVAGEYQAANLELNNGDVLDMRVGGPGGSFASLILGTPGIILKSDSLVSLGIVESRTSGADSITIRGHNNEVNVTQSLKTLGGRGIFIESGIQNKLNVKVLESSGHGIYVKGGGLNEIPQASLRNIGGHGVFIENSENNFFNKSTITGAAGNGILIVGGKENRIDDVTITGAEYGIELRDTMGNRIGYISYTKPVIIKGNRKSGLYINGGGSNNVAYARYEQNGLHGVELVNTRLNLLPGVVSLNNTGNGIHIGSGSRFNELYSNATSENENGVVVEGPGTAYNEVGGFIGDIEVSGQWMVKGNRKNGVYIRNGANFNDISSAWIHGSGQHGVLMEGAGTTNNLLKDFLIGAINSWDSPTGVGNALDGVRITGGASRNQLSLGYIGYSGGNGITITGAGTDFNVIQRTQVGGIKASDVTAFKQRTGWDWTWMGENQGLGMLIADGAFGTVVQETALGVNLGGGLKILNVRKTWGANEQPFALALIEGIRVGSVTQSIPSSGSLTVRTVDSTAGNGIHLESSTDVVVGEFKPITGVESYSYVDGHNIGIYIGGTNPGRHNIKVGVNKTSRQGVLVENSVGDVLDVNVSQAGSHGIQLSQTTDTTLPSVLVEKNTGHGIYLYKAKKAVLKAIKLGAGGITDVFYSSENQGRGLSIESSQDVRVTGGRFQKNVGHGILVEDSDFIKIESPDVQENGGTGILLFDSGGIEIYRVRPFESDFSVNNNQGAGINVTASQDVTIGQSRRYLGGGLISGNGLQGIMISGSTTSNVNILGNYIDGNKAEGVGVYDGSNILIGGPTSDQGNNIQFNPIGILAKGSLTKLSILSNNIGETPEFKSGTRQWGNGVGIKLQDSISEVRIKGNTISSNKQEGILLTGGASRNMIADNTITDNGADGIRMDGTTTLYNTIRRNSITGNVLKGIELLTGGNGEIEAPVVNQVTWRGYSIAGTVSAPRGSTVEVYADDDDEGEKHIGSSALYGNNFYVNADVPPGRKIHAIVIHPNGNTSEFGPAILSSVQDFMVFNSTRDGNQEVYLSQPGGMAPKRLTNNTAADHTPRLSPNPDRILFVSDRGGNPDLWAMGKDGANPIRLTQDPAAEYDPGWAGADKALFVSDKEGNPEIYSMNIPAVIGPTGEVAYDDGTAEQASSVAKDQMLGVHFSTWPGTLTRLKFYILTNPGQFKWMVLNWDSAANKPGTTVIAEANTTPTGLSWHTVDTGNIQVPADYVVAVKYLADSQPGLGKDISSTFSDRSVVRYADWSEFWGNLMIRATVQPVPPTRLTQNTFVDRYPAMSPDKSKVAFASDRSGNMEIWVMNADGGSPVQLTNSQGADYKPAWSPDGSKIAFVSERDGNPEIYLMPASGGNVTRLTNNSVMDSDPAWSRDGQRILFSSDRGGGMEIYSTAPAMGAVATRLTTSLGSNAQPDAGSFVSTSVGGGGSAAAAQLAPVKRPPGMAPGPVRRSPAQAKPAAVTPASTPAPPNAGRVGAVVTPAAGPAGPRADGSPVLAIESGTASPGATISLKINLQGASNLGTMAFDIAYDRSKLTLLGVTPGEIPLAQNALYAVNPQVFPSSTGLVRFASVRASGHSGSGEVATLAFRVEGYVSSGQIPVNFQNIVGADANLTGVSITGQGGVITVVILPVQHIAGFSQSVGADGIVLLNIEIKRVRNPSSDANVLAPGGIKAFDFTLAYAGGSTGNAINVMDVKGAGPFSTVTPTIQNAAGSTRVSATQSSSAPQAPLTLVGVAPRIIGSASVAQTISLTFTSLLDVTSGANIPADGVKTFTVRRGDARNDGTVDMSDALFIAQYRVGIREPGETTSFTHIVNGASVKLESTVTGEKLDMNDALFIAQYRVGLRDDSFNWR